MPYAPTPAHIHATRLTLTELAFALMLTALPGVAAALLRRDALLASSG